LVKRSSVPRLVVVDDPRSPGAEAYRLLRIDLQHVSSDPLRRILITSARPGEGKSTSVVNLGAAFAQAERSVLVIDADMRRPTLHTVFRQPSAPGLSTYLAGNAMLAAILHKTSVPNLTLIASGPIPPNPADLLASRRMRDLLEEVTERFDVVLLDSPPILAVSDACALASLVDGVLLVVGSGDTPEVALRRAKAQVEAVRGRLLGAVVNRFNAKANGYSSHEYDSYDSYYGVDTPAKGGDAKKGPSK
jgi:capsular exopolysaccharide synthesis family protein